MNLFVDEISTYAKDRQQTPSTSGTKNALFKFNVSESIRNFTGRREHLETLVNSLSEERCSMVVSGMGGVGKTCLVRHFVNMKEVAEWNILWLTTETEQDLQNCLNEAAEHIEKLVKKSILMNWNEKKELKKQLGNFYEALYSMGRKTLLVFDNADDKYGKFDEKVLAAYFPISLKSHLLIEGYKHPHIIVTTRREMFLKHLESKRINLSPLAENEAIDLCKKTLESYGKFPSKDIERLCFCLGNYPLAIQQAIAYLNEMMGVVSIDDFIEKYKKSVKIFQEKEAQLGEHYAYTVATVFDLSLETIAKTENALEMMYILSFCDAEKTILYLFEYLYGKESAQKALATLVKFNLASFEKHLSVHRVVQKVVRDRVLEDSDLIEVVLQAAFIDFKIYKTFEKNNKKIYDPECILNAAFLNDWNIIHADVLAGLALSMALFCKLDNFYYWNEIFGSEKWDNAITILEQTCLRWTLQLGPYSIPAEVKKYILHIISQNRSQLLDSLKSVSSSLDSLKNNSVWTNSNLPIRFREDYIKKLKDGVQYLQVSANKNIKICRLYDTTIKHFYI